MAAIHTHVRVPGENAARDDGSRWWTAAVLLAAAPLVVALCLTLWQSPYPITEAVALFEDVANRPAARFLVPDTPYYRPLFHLTLSALWHGGGTLAETLARIKLLQIGAVVLLVGLFIWHLRPRSLLDAAAGGIAVAVLVGSPGLRDNLEIPLSYTTVGMPLALLAWILLNAEARWWRAAAIVALALVAIGFKEQGLVVVPLALAAWWTRAPGEGRGLAVAMAVVGVGYVALRLSWPGSLPLFEQAVGLGFGEMEPSEAVARFGAFPYWVYAYSSASTIANVLFAEPARGTFRIVHAALEGRTQLWQVLHVGSSVASTVLVGWWGTRALRRAARDGWSYEARLFVGMAVVLLACGALSFAYSRDRMGGMAAPFYALTVFFAVRAAAETLAAASRRRLVLGALGLVLLAGAWQTRAVATIEYVRATALRNQMEWLVLLPARREEFARRQVYLDIMHAMIEQGTNPAGPRPIRFPQWVALTIGQP